MGTRDPVAKRSPKKKKNKGSAAPKERGTAPNAGERLRERAKTKDPIRTNRKEISCFVKEEDARPQRRKKKEGRYRVGCGWESLQEKNGIGNW